MKINLNDPVIRFVVQEYVQSIVNASTRTELDFDVHKLIHTFWVVQTAAELIKRTRPALSDTCQRQIMNAAVLHDIARCHEFDRRGQRRTGFDHGRFGATLIRKVFPDLQIEAASTRLHNKSPSDKDPSRLQPVLNYVRDSDILGNIRYIMEHLLIFMQQTMPLWPPSATPLILNTELQRAACEKRPCIYSRMDKFDFCDMMAAQLLWVYNLRTLSARRWAKRTRLFPRYRDMMIRDMLPLISGTDRQRKEVARMIMFLFPDTLFHEALK